MYTFTSVKGVRLCAQWAGGASTYRFDCALAQSERTIQPKATTHAERAISSFHQDFPQKMFEHQSRNIAKIELQ